MALTQQEERRLQDALLRNLEGLIGVRQALYLARDESNEYPMHQMLAEAMENNIERILAALPDDWDMSELHL